MTYNEEKINLKDEEIEDCVCGSTVCNCECGGSGLIYHNSGQDDSVCRCMKEKEAQDKADSTEI